MSASNTASMSGTGRSSTPSRSAIPPPSSISPRCSSRSRSAASLLGVAQVFARMGIQRRWRAWLTNRVLTRWLDQRPLLPAQSRQRRPQESGIPHRRGSADRDRFAGRFHRRRDLGVAVGGDLHRRALDHRRRADRDARRDRRVTIPGFLVIAAVIYAAIASGSIMVIGRRFVQVSEDKNQAEAEFRYALTRVRENGESIALLGGEEEERDGIDKTFTNVLRQWARLAGQHMRTTLVSQGSSLIAPVVPLLLCAPKFLDGSMTLGQVMQAASAFTIVQSAFGWLVDNYPRLADWNACARRIASLMMSLDGLERAEQGDGFGRIKRGETEGDAMLEPERSLRDARRRHRRGRRDRSRDRARRAAAGGRRIRHRQEHAGARHRGAVAMGRRQRQFPSRPAAVHAAAKALRAVGHAAPRGRLSRRRRRLDASKRSAKPWTRSASTISRRRSRKRRRGTRRCPAAKSSGSPSRGCCCTTPTSSCWTKRPRRSTRRARTR